MTPEALAVALSRGPRSASELQRALSVSKSTLQRALSQAGLLTVGRARATRYAARRRVDGVHTPVPVYELDSAGASRLALTLHPVEPFGFYVEGHVPEVTSGFECTSPTDSDLPWFLADARPQGFLGRAWARVHADQGYPVDLERWTADQVLRFFAHYGVELSGAFVVGAFALDLLSGGPDRSPTGDLPTRAARALAEAPWGSSPAGEQPKFAEPGWIVKFSPTTDTPDGRRWADLLVAEHLVHEVLRERGVEAARSEVVDAGGRRFLRVERFDRHGERGRSGLVSLAALDPSGVARELRSWSVGTAALVRAGRLTAEDHARVGWLEAFGHLTANADMHPGNLSFRMRGTSLQGLAPVYDLLPMAFAPRHGELPSEPWVPSAHRSAFPPSAVEAARALWDRVVASRDVSDAFKRLAGRQLAVLPG